MDNAIFRNSVFHEKYYVNGFLILQMSDLDLPERLKKICHAYKQPDGLNYLYASNHMNEYNFNRNLDEEVEIGLSNLLDEHFCNYRYLTGHLMIKPPSEDGEFQLHQDWSITDEQTYSVAHLWIPLQDTSPENGGMFVIKGSHRYFNNYRSGSLDIPRIQRDKIVNRMITPLHVKKGQMLVYHPALFHGSFPNLSKNNREVILVNLLHKAAPLLYYHKGQKDTLETYTLTKRALLADLQIMIKGGVPQDSVLLNKRPLNQPDNAAMRSEDLFDCYRKRHPGMLASLTRLFKRRI